MVVVVFTPYLLGSWNSVEPGGLACTYASDLHCDAAYSIENVIIEMTKISKYSLRICSHKNKSVCSVHFSHGLVVS